MLTTTDDLRITQIKELSTPEEVMREIPRTLTATRVVTASRNAIHSILNDVDDRLLVVVGPCSVHDPAAAVDYAERLVGLFAGDRRVFDRVVQHRRRDGRVIDLELGQNGRDLERMGEIGIARSALLATMRLHREHIGAVQQILVGMRIVAANPLHQFVLPHHRRKPTRSAPRAADLSWRRQCGSTRTGRRE